MDKPPHDNSPKGRNTIISFRVAEHEHHLFRAAAARRGEFVSVWLRRAAQEALRRDLTLRRRPS
jgi:hypothetical protein